MPALDHPTRPQDTPAAAEVTARVKILNPLISSGPSMHGALLGFTNTGLQLRVPRCILLGSIVQVRTPGRVVFGEVRSSTPVGEQYEIEVLTQRSS
jgi:hypothetical protein